MEVPIDTILDDIAPQKSGKVYKAIWDMFLTDVGMPGAEHLQEKHFLAYFYGLKKKGYKSSTLWNRFSILNNVYQRHTGKKLQLEYPRVIMQLKAYQNGYQRKCAKTFSLQEFLDFMKKPLQSKYWVVRKAFAAIAWSGGLRCHELHQLKIGSIKFTTEGCQVSFEHAKQVAEVKQNTILVPFNKTNPSICLASKVKMYLDELGPLANDKTSPLFKGCMKGKHFVKSPMGKNTLHSIGKDVAKELGLDDWSCYTGHCWRRSSATQVAGEGASVVDMKRQFGWRQESTAMRYIDGTETQMLKMATLSTGQKSLSIVSRTTNVSPTMINEQGSSSNEPKAQPSKAYHLTFGDNCNITIN